MQLMPIIVAILLGALALAFVLSPLYRRSFVKIETITSSGTTATTSQTEREQTARTALQEIELDFQLGNLAETDYRSLRERYVRRAFLAMKSRQDHEQELDEVIEERLRQMKVQNENEM